MAKRSKPVGPPQPTPELPPKVPSSRKDLERAITLLGTCAKGVELSERKRVELIVLVGGYPNARTAANWKAGLRSVRDDEIFDAVG